MFGYTGGEIFIIVFIVVAILTARFWPAMGERIMVSLGGRNRGR